MRLWPTLILASRELRVRTGAGCPICPWAVNTHSSPDTA
jgi:hypothetical protein